MLSVGGQESHQAKPVGSDGLMFSLPWSAGGTDKVKVKMRVHFTAHYGEPPLTCEITTNKSKGEPINTTCGCVHLYVTSCCSLPDVEEVLHVEYNPFTGEWNVEEESDRLATQLAAVSLS